MVRSVLLRAKADRYSALTGIFYAITDKIDEYLTQANLVTPDIAREIRRLVQQKPQSLLLSSLVHHIGDITQHSAEVEGSDIHLPATSLDFRYLEYVVNDG
jgi:hypothetical protein